MFSHSKIGTFENCPLQFKYRYIDKVEVEVEQTIEAFLGTLVHEALEKLYKDKMFQKENTLDDLLKFYKDEWKKRWNKAIKIVRRGYTEKNYRDMGIKFITDYYNMHKPFDEGHTIGLEKQIHVTIGPYKLVGYIDRITFLGNGHYEVHDYKTSATLMTQEKADADRQLALYSIAVKQMFPDAKKVDLVWHYLAFDKEVRSARTDKQLEKLQDEILEGIREIEKAAKAGTFPAKESALCSWCAYREICPRWTHAEKVEELPPNKYLKDPGVKLVNKYVELNAKIKELGQELEEIKDALIAFRDKTGSENIQGSDFVARVRQYDSWTFPKAGTEDREKLEKTLEKTGKLEDVKTFSTFALAKALPLWDESTRKKIEKYAKSGKVDRIYLGKIK